MTINLTVPQTMQELRPRITVVGVGGAGWGTAQPVLPTRPGASHDELVLLDV